MMDIKAVLDQAIRDHDTYHDAASRNYLVQSILNTIHAIVEAKLHPAPDPVAAQAASFISEYTPTATQIQPTAAQVEALGPMREALAKATEPTTYPLTVQEIDHDLIHADIKDWTKQPGHRDRYSYAGWYMLTGKTPRHAT